MGPRLLFSASNLSTSHHQILLSCCLLDPSMQIFVCSETNRILLLKTFIQKVCQKLYGAVFVGGCGRAVVTNELILPNDLIFWQGATTWSVVKKIGKKKLEIWVHFNYLTMNFWISVLGAYLSQMLHLPVWKLMKLYIMLPHICLYSSSLFGIGP